MVSLVFICLYIFACGVNSYPPQKSFAPSPPCKKNDKMGWNKQFRDFPIYFSELYYPQNDYAHNHRYHHQETPLDIPKPISHGTDIKTNPDNSKPLPPDLSTNKNTTSSNGTVFSVQNLFDIKENGCPTGYDKDPNGDCQKILN